MNKFKVGDRVHNRPRNYDGTVIHVAAKDGLYSIRRDDGKPGTGHDKQWSTYGKQWDLIETGSGSCEGEPDWPIEEPIERKYLQAMHVNTSAILYAIDQGYITAAKAKPALHGCLEAYHQIGDELFGDSLTDRVVARVVRLKEQIQAGEL